MLVVSWSRVFALILPGLIETYGLTLEQAGRCVSALEAGGFLAMLLLSFAIDRWGALRLLPGCLLVGIGALFLSTLAPSYEILLLFFFFLGAGTAATASAVNALMADTGPKRGFYLGIVHSAFGLFSIAAPLAAGALIVYSGWQAYYLLVGLLGLIVTLLFFFSTRTDRQSWHPPAVASSSGAALATLWRIAPLCMGVSTLVGIQGVFNSWSYLYSVDRFALSHATATLAPSCIWLGILLGRAGHTGLSRRFAPRPLLLASCLLTGAAALGAYLAPVFGLAFAAFVGIGMGVGGAYQLGTAWATDRAPEHIGAASTFIMAAAALGSAIWPWLAGLVVGSNGFTALPWVVLIAVGVGLAAFALSRT